MPEETMQAMVYERYGPPEVLQAREVPRPQPGPGQVLVRVHWATVNRTDCHLLSGSPAVMRLVAGLRRPRKTVPGTEFSGEVAALGQGVTAWREGDKVFGFDDTGLQACAQYLVMNADGPLGAVPANRTLEEVAGVLEGVHYARNMCNKVRLTPGQHALVHGATGAIGSAALQLLKAAGLHVTATCRGEHADLIRGLGADAVLDYTREDFTAGGGPYRAVFDSVGKSTFGRCRPVLEPRGVYVSSELGPWGQNIPLALAAPLLAPLLRGHVVRFPLPLGTPASIALAREMLEAGTLRVLVERTYPLADLAAAYRHAASGEKVGVLRVRVD